MSRFFSLLFIMLLAWGGAAGAGEFRGTILSWDQFKRLAPAKRAAYLRDYRKVLSLMEDQQRRFGIYEASNDTGNFSKKIAFIVDYFSLIPQADADSVSETAPTTTQTGAAPVYPKWDGSWRCSWAKSGGKQFVFDPSFGTCLTMVDNKLWSTNKDSLHACPGPAGDFEGSVAVPYSKTEPGKWACIPITSYLATSEKEKDRLNNGERLPEGTFDPKATEANTREMVVGNLKEALARNAEANSKLTAQNRKADDPKPSPVPLDSDSCSEPKAKSCGKVDEKDADIVAFRRDTAEDANSCIVGGFFSKYRVNNPKKEVGKCDIPTKFTSPAGDEIRTCDDSGKAMCNPFVFCMVDAKGFFHTHCEAVSKTGANVTERCEKYFDAFTSETGAASDEADASARRKGKKGKRRKTASSPAARERGAACDPTSEIFKKGLVDNKAVGDAWNEQKEIFEKNFRKRCVNEGSSQSEKGFQKLLCNECQVMARMLYKMNKEAINYGCTSKAELKPEPPPAASGSAVPGGFERQDPVPFLQPSGTTH